MDWCFTQRLELGGTVIEVLGKPWRKKYFYMLEDGIAELLESIVFLKPFKTTAMQAFDNWTKDEFLSLLCICGAQADMKISEAEIDWIIQYFGEGTYHKTRAVFDQQTDYENYEALKYLKQKLYTDDSATNEIRNNLKALFSADGDYSMLEKNYERALARLLES